MKKLLVLSALITGVVVGQSESQGVETFQEKDAGAPSIVHGRPKPLHRGKKKTRKFFSGKLDKTGCERTEEDGHSVSERNPPYVSRVQTPSTSSESEYLKEIASVLSIPVSKDDTPGDIAFKIKQCIGNAECYRGNVLSDESSEKAKSAIRIPSDAETFEAYNAFIKKVAGKRIVILDCKE